MLEKMSASPANHLMIYRLARVSGQSECTFAVSRSIRINNCIDKKKIFSKSGVHARKRPFSAYERLQIRSGDNGYNRAFC